MSSIFNVEHEVVGGSVRAAVYVSSKSPADDLAARTYGDVYVRRSGLFNDPEDNTFPQFRVDCGDEIGVLLNVLPNYKIETFFDDQSISVTARMRQASLWTAALISQITAGLTTLRLKTDTTGGNTAVTI